MTRDQKYLRDVDAAVPDESTEVGTSYLNVMLDLKGFSGIQVTGYQMRTKVVDVHNQSFAVFR